MAMYCYLHYVGGIIPLGGKKAPSYVIVLIFQYLLVKKLNASRSVHFLKLFLFQYIFVLTVALIGGVALYYFYQMDVGQGVLTEYIQLSVSELQVYKSKIIEQEGIEYYKNLLEGINGISPGSIAKDEISQKIALAFLPNLLISLYFKQ
jgi:hypothetical protein